MCGICGIIDWNETMPSEERNKLVITMNQALVHRGPDGEGFFTGRRCSLAMRRLAIIDTKGGDQPIFNETGDICIFFNGEIYNFLELRTLLIKKGHQFTTRSDTEVLIHLYEEYGKEMLEKLRGMFSFCIYDQKKEQYLLARDRFGEKPLFYHFVNGSFSFSSEIKSLLENNRITRQLNDQALPYYFRTSLVPEPMTLLQNVYSLRPGQYILMSKDHFEQEAYFVPKYIENPRPLSEQEALDLVQPVLIRAVNRQRVSDVPIGAFLSGGIDSSTIVALLQQQSNKPIKTFNVRFEDQEYDESPIARKVAQYCGTEHSEIFIPNVKFEAEIFWTIIDHIGFPFRDSSAIPTYLISKEIAKQVKVALSGDGGDELFGGYDLFRWYQKILSLKNIASGLRSKFKSGIELAQQLPLLKDSSVLRKIDRGVRTSLLDVEDIPIALNEMFTQEQIPAFGNGRGHNTNYEYLKRFPVKLDGLSSLRRIMYYRIYHTLPTNMLVKIDRMSMASSLEVRAPFLDADLFEITAQLPDQYLVSGNIGKVLLRKIMKNHLPTEVFNHPKRGFNLPLHHYQNAAYKRLAEKMLFEDSPLAELIPEDFLKKVFQNGITNKSNSAKQSVFRSSHQLWMLMQLGGWLKRFDVKISSH